MTPHADGAAVRAAKGLGLLAVPGFFTPAEADGLKLFPAEGSSPAMLRALRAVLPDGTMVLPVGASMYPTWEVGKQQVRRGLGLGRRSTGWGIRRRWLASRRMR